MNLVLVLCLVVAAIGVFVMWPGTGTSSWWIGAGTRDSRAGRARLLAGDVLLIGGLIGTIVVQLIGVRWDVGVVIVLAVQVVLVLLVVRLAVRHRRSMRELPVVDDAGGSPVE